MNKKQRAYRRREVYQRDDFQCRACGWTPLQLDKKAKLCYTGRYTIFEGNRYLTLDHIKPKSKGGNSRTHNLQCMCNVCNKRKGDKMPEGVKI